MPLTKIIFAYYGLGEEARNDDDIRRLRPRVLGDVKTPYSGG